VYNVEHVILTGRIVERQRDPRRKEWKYFGGGRDVGRRRGGGREQDRTDQEAGGSDSVRAVARGKT
jgi:hypothetical protein